VPTYRNSLLCKIFNLTDCILSLNIATLTLKTFCWYVMLTFARCNFHCLPRPVLGEDRLSLDALRDHRNMHHFLGPCCLCPLMRPVNEEPRYREVAIYMPVMGRYKGKYIAECARNLCGFIGWSLFSLNKDFSYTTAQFPWRETTTSSTESPWRDIVAEVGSKFSEAFSMEVLMGVKVPMKVALCHAFIIQRTPRNLYLDRLKSKVLKKQVCDNIWLVYTVLS